MTDFDMALQALLGLAQIALAVIGLDAVLGYFFDAAFLTGILKQFAYTGGLIGTIDQAYWLATERLPKLLDMY